MCKAAVLMAQGYEEGETLTIVDLLRRADIQCDTFSFDEEYVEGMHHMMIRADKRFNEEINDYDMVILPGGRPGGENLRNNPDVIALLQRFNTENKYIGALCSGTTVLEEAKVIQGKRVTGYTGYASKLTSGVFVDEVAVADKNLVTSQGPATPYPFAFKIMEIFGKDPSLLKERLMYNFAKGR